MKSRFFLMDHCCTKAIGHNGPSLRFFESYFSEYFDETFIFVADSFTGKASSFHSCLADPYEGIINADTVKQKKLNQVYNDRLFRFWNKISNRLSQRLTGFDFIESRMAQNIEALDVLYHFTNRDTILLPSAEMYGIKALVDFFLKQPSTRRPRLHFRLIAVFENLSVGYKNPLKQIFQSIEEARIGGLDVQLSCETPAYLQVLQKIVPDAFLFPYPITLHQNSFGKDPDLIVSLGQGRYDKGYFRLANIIEQVTKICPQAHWIIHSMPESDPKYSASYQEKLEKLPNVELTRAVLSDIELKCLYKAASVSVLPYSQATYRLRGSAVLQESLAFGQLCVVPAATGISSMLDLLGNGLSAQTDDDYANAVKKILSLNKSVRLTRLEAARQRYFHTLEIAVAKVLKD